MFVPHHSFPFLLLSACSCTFPADIFTQAAAVWRGAGAMSGNHNHNHNNSKTATSTTLCWCHLANGGSCFESEVVSFFLFCSMAAQLSSSRNKGIVALLLRIDEEEAGRGRKFVCRQGGGKEEAGRGRRLIATGKEAGRGRRLFAAEEAGAGPEVVCRR